MKLLNPNNGSVGGSLYWNRKMEHVTMEKPMQQPLVIFKLADYPQVPKIF